MAMRDRAQRLHEETELLRILVATLLSEVDALVPDREEGQQTGVDVLARMITTTAADLSADLHRLAGPDMATPTDMANVVQLPRENTTHARTHPVFSTAVPHRRTAGRP